jgi:nitroreductase
MMLVAWELGIGSCHVAVYEPELTRSLLGYPEGSRCDYLISLGYRKEGAEAADRSRPIERRPMQELRHDEHW